jgi:hypothetical protein
MHPLHVPTKHNSKTTDDNALIHIVETLLPTLWDRYDYYRVPCSMGNLDA